MGLRSRAPTEGESAPPVRRPGAVIVTHDGLGFAVAECDEVGGHSGILRSWLGLNPAHGAIRRALLIFHFWSLQSATKQGSKRAFATGHSTDAREATQMP